MQVVKQATPVLPQAQAKFEEENQVVVSSGLYGNPLSGQAWNEGKDGKYAGVTKITVTTNKEHTVTSIQLQYNKRTGGVVDGDRHGGFGRETVFELDYPKEFLIKVTGYYGPALCSRGVTIIKSLTFITNKGKYGPVGKEEGESFETKPLNVVPTDAPIVGFFGRADEAFLYAIGVYYGLIYSKINSSPSASHKNQFKSISFSHIYREQNQEADTLSKRGLLSLKDCYISRTPMT